jgi:hypothetical protein
MITPTVFAVGAYDNRAVIDRNRGSELVELTAIVAITRVKRSGAYTYR